MLGRSRASEIPSGKQLLAFGTRSARFFGYTLKTAAEGKIITCISISAPVYICQECEPLFEENDTASGTKSFQVSLFAQEQLLSMMRSIKSFKERHEIGN